MTEISLRQLRYFDALATHSHFGRAAAVCSVTQPALSMQIKELEEALGTTLIERGARQVRLTRFGEHAIQRAREILRFVDELGDAARASRDEFVGRLRIGMIPTIAPYLLPTLMGRLAKTYPQLEVHVREALTSKLIQEVMDGRLGCGDCCTSVSSPALTETALILGEFSACAAGRG